METFSLWGPLTRLARPKLQCWGATECVEAVRLYDLQTLSCFTTARQDQHHTAGFLCFASASSPRLSDASLQESTMFAARVMVRFWHLHLLLQTEPV